jgi:hypothetical protein
MDEGWPEGLPTKPGPTTPLRPAVPAAAGSSSIRSHRATAPLALVARGRVVQAFHMLRLLPDRAARGFLAWSRRPSGRLALPGTLILTMLLAGALAGAILIPASGGQATADPGGTAAATGAPAGSPAPTAPLLPVPPITTPELIHPGNPTDALRDWADQIAERTGIPVIAVLAYGYAELVIANTTPECNLHWTTLAAIGRVESNHGHTGDSALLSDGRAVPAIIGDPLDGQGGRQLIPDTDGGELDGDPEYDRAVGPMQFIPETWRIEAVDATGDGIADVHNIHDAALAAANYLCRGGRDLATAADWWAAIHAYNNVSVYAEAVFAAANEYGQRSRQH